MEPTADCWREKRLLFLFLNEVFPNEGIFREGVSLTHISLSVSFQKKNKNKWLVVLLNQAMMLCERTNSPGGLCGEGALMLVNSGPKREQVVPSTDELCVQERSCTSPSWWTQPPAHLTKPPDLGLGRSSLSRPAAHPGQQRGGCSGTSWGELGSNAGWGELRGKKPYFILLIQFPAGRSG